MRSLARIASTLVLSALASGALGPDAALHAVPCVDYGGYSWPVGYTATSDGISDVAIAGSRAYAAEADSGLRVIDLSEPDAPRPGASVRLSGYCFGVDVDGQWAYVAAWNSGLHAVDIADPHAPVQVGRLDLPGPNVRVAVHRFYPSWAIAFVASLDRGVRLVGLFDPAAPLYLGAIETRGNAGDVTIAGRYLYIADSYGLMIVDLGNPYIPTIVGRVDIPTPGGFMNAVAVQGSSAYLGTCGRMYVVDVSQPNWPVIVASIGTGCTQGIGVSGSLAIVGGGDDWATRFIDISNPHEPRYAGAIGSGVVSSVAIAADIACVGMSYPPWVESEAAADTTGAHGSVALQRRRVEGPASWSGGLQVLHVGPLGWLGPVGRLPVQAVDVEVEGTRAYVPSFEAGLQVIDVSDPAAPVVRATLDTPGHARAVALSGGYAYLTDGPGGMHIVDVSNSDVPHIVGHTDVPGFANEIAAGGDLALVSFKNGQAPAPASGVVAVDVSNPAAPAVLDTIVTPGEASGVAMAEPYAYIGGTAFWVVDVSNPTECTIVGATDTPGIVWDVVPAGPVAYVADSDSGFAVLDVSDPTRPLLIGRVDTPGTASEVALSGRYAYVADGYGGVPVYDVSNPATPLFVGRIIDDPYGVATGNGHVYTVAWEFDVYPEHCAHTTPVVLGDFQAVGMDGEIRIRWRIAATRPTEFALARAAGEAPSSDAYRPLAAPAVHRGGGVWECVDRDVLAAETYSYELRIAVPGEGTQRFGPVVGTAGAPRFAHVRAAPNPARGGTTLRFDLPRRGDARLQVFDVAGRRVRRIVPGPLEAGRHAAFWDGRDDSGLPVASGTYFVQLVGSGGSARSRVLLLR